MPKARARGAPLIRDFGKPISARKFGLVMTSLRPTDRRPYVRTLLHVSQCKMRHSKKCVEVASPTAF